ncbi:MAG: methyl-accepting chemotaxis protein [Actinobacteria bacterium]|nr:MAG: methyl-accepting chemotaxis protein [Actinomycetota bacterium]
MNERAGSAATTGPARSRLRLPLRWLADLRLRGKFLIIVVLGAVIATAIGVTSLVSMSRMQATSDRIYRENMLAITELRKLEKAVQAMRMNVLDAALSSSESIREQFIGALTDLDTAVDEAFAAYSDREQSGGRDVNLALLREGLAEYRDVRDNKLLPAVRSGDRNAFALARDSEALPASYKINVALGNLIEIETIAARLSNADSHSAYATTWRNSTTFLVVGVLASLLIGLTIARIVTRSIDRVANALAALEKGDLTVSTGVHSKDEVGVMAAALDKAIERLREVIGVMRRSAYALAESASELSAISDQITHGAQETSREAEVAATTAGQVSANIHSVANSSEEMGTSISEIANSASEAARVAQTANEIADAVSKAVAKLSVSSSEIGNVTNLITAIAEQTNLLALNATIEAARAGEMGKGFAVVASEVKELAQETARATSDISRQIAEIQSDSETAIQAIAEIINVIEKINGFSTAIASAVDQQTATSAEISRNVTEAASGSAQIAQNISGVAQAAQSTAAGVKQAQQAAGELSRMSEELRRIVAGFTV